LADAIAGRRSPVRNGKPGVEAGSQSGRDTLDWRCGQRTCTERAMRDTAVGRHAGGSLTVGIIPKSTRNPYFQDCQRGAEEATRERGFTRRWDGPAEVDARRQAEVVAAWTRDAVPVIAVSVESGSELIAALTAARAAGTKVLTWDSDGPPETRE